MPEPLILLADDSADDIFIFKRAVGRAGFANPVAAVQTGQLAIDYLNGLPPYADRTEHPLPGLIILDLKMPLLDGFQVLTWIKSSPFAHLPTVILSASDNPVEKARAHQLGASDYRAKPLEPAALVSLVLELHQRWLNASSESGGWGSGVTE